MKGNPQVVRTRAARPRKLPRVAGRTAEEDAAAAEIIAFAPPEMFCEELRNWARQFFVDQRAANERERDQ